MIWRIFSPWRNEIACEWGHVAYWLTGELYTGFWWENRGKGSTWKTQA